MKYFLSDDINPVLLTFYARSVIFQCLNLKCFEGKIPLSCHKPSRTTSCPFGLSPDFTHRQRQGQVYDDWLKVRKLKYEGKLNG